MRAIATDRNPDKNRALNSFSLYIGVDGNDQNLAQNLKGGVEEVYSAASDQLFEASAFAPYSEVFGIQRFRECELQHGRWAMLATLGAVVSELSTGVTW